MSSDISLGRVPAYRRHKPSGQAVVTLSGRDHYVGKWNTQASRREYDRLIGQWLAAGRMIPQADVTAGPTVAETLVDYLQDVVADMVRLQSLTGCRPAEDCILRPCDVDMSGDVWVYRPESHKTEHHGQERAICIGPHGQDVLRPSGNRPSDPRGRARPI